MMKNLFYIIIFSNFFIGCTTSKILSNAEVKPIHPSSKPILDSSQSIKKNIVFKSAQDVSKLVPVRLSADKKDILSYPAPTDLYDLTTKKLANGYVLDLVGVNANTAYLNMTIQEYKNTTHVILKDELLKRVTLINPYLEMYECIGIESEFIEWIENGVISQKCKQIQILNK